MLYRDSSTSRAGIARRAARWLVAGALLGAWVVGLGACSSELDPTEAEGAYYIFRNGILEGDADAVWAQSDAQTHAYFDERYDQLVEMDETIQKYLPQSDHRIARKDSGASLLDEIDGGKGLFRKVFRPDKLAGKQAMRVGSDLDELKVSEDGKAAKVLTRAGQTYVLGRDDDSGQWHVELIRSTDAIDHSMAWLESNQSALQKTVQDLISEERNRREAMIAELLDPETTPGSAK